MKKLLPIILLIVFFLGGCRVVDVNVTSSTPPTVKEMTLEETLELAEGAGYDSAYTGAQVDAAVAWHIAGIGTALTALNGENIQDDTIDDDSIDFTDVTLLDFGLAITHDTAAELDALYEVQLTNEAGLYGVLSDVTNFLQTGDALAGDDITDGSVDASEVDESSLVFTNLIDSGAYVDGSIDHEHLAADVISGMTEITSADADYIVVWDATDSALKRVDMGEVRGSGAETNNLETLTTGIATTEIPIGTAADTVVYAALSGDVTMANDGAVTIANNAVENAMMADNSVDSDDYADGSIDEPHLNVSNAGTDNYLLSYNAAGTNFTWVAAGAGSGDLLADGTVPLTAGWDAGSYKITAQDLTADTGDVTVGDDILLADGAVVGITGNEVITFNAAGSINVTGATVDVDGAFTAASVASDAAVSGTTITGSTSLIAPLIDAAGAEDMDYGSDNVTDHTFTTDGTGTAEIVLPAGSIDGTEILDDTIQEPDLNSTNAATDNYLLSYNAAGTNFTWVAAGVGDVTGAAVFTDNTLIKGDGGAKGVQDSGITIDDSDNVSGMGTLAVGAITSTGDMIIGSGGDPADAGTIRLKNGDSIAWEDGTETTITHVNDQGLAFNAPIYIAEQAEANADTAGFAQIWVNTATPNELWWTDDAGTDTQLGVGGTDDQTLAEVLGEGADGNDVDITSLGKLEFFDAGLYIDADADGVMDITSDGTLELHSSDWDISTTGTITGVAIGGDQIVDDSIDASEVDESSLVLTELIDSDDYVDGSIDHEHLAADVISGMTEITSADADYLLVWDDTDSALKKVDMGEVRGSGAEENNLETVATGIATTEIPIGTAADTVVYASLSGDITMDNAGATLIATDAVTSEKINTDAVTMDAVDADGNFTDLTGNWSTTGTFGSAKITSTAAVESSGLFDITGAGNMTFGSADVSAFILSGADETLTLTPTADLVTVTTGTGVAEIDFSAIDLQTTGSVSGQAEVQTDASGVITLQVNAVNYGSDTGKANIPTGACDAAADVGNWVVLISSAADAYQMTSDDESNQFIIAANAAALTANDELDVDGTMVCVMCIAAELWKVTGYMGAIPTDGGVP